MPLLLPLLLALLLQVSASLGAGRFVYGNLFYTGGNGTNGNESAELAGYGTFSLRDRHFLTLAYAATAIDHPGWTYDQQLAIAGGITTLRGVTLKAHYGHVSGAFNLPGWSYSDKADFGSAELMRYVAPGYLGLGMVHYRGIGKLQPSVNQFSARLEWPFARRFYLSLRPGFTRALELVGNDDRRLSSLGARLTYQPHVNWVLRTGGFVGQRAYYFDNDLLILSNQHETQTGQAFAQLDARLYRQIWLSGEYLYSQFDGYDIRYAVLGVKSRLPL